MIVMRVQLLYDELQDLNIWFCWKAAGCSLHCSTLLHNKSYLELEDSTTTGRLGSEDHFLQLVALHIAIFNELVKVVRLDSCDEFSSISLLDEGHSAATPTGPCQATAQSPLLFALCN